MNIQQILTDLRREGTVKFQKPAGEGHSLIYELTYNEGRYHYRQFVSVKIVEGIDLDVTEKDCIALLQILRNIKRIK
jgi:hypothetical protein